MGKIAFAVATKKERWIIISLTYSFVDSLRQIWRRRQKRNWQIKNIIHHKDVGRFAKHTSPFTDVITEKFRPKSAGRIGQRDGSLARR